MFVLVAYDVSTSTSAGMKRLSRIAKICKNFGQRVQNSVFECYVDPAQWVSLKAQLLKTYSEKDDSLRFYFLGNKWDKRIEHHGVNSGFNPTQEIIL